MVRYQILQQNVLISINEFAILAAKEFLKHLIFFTKNLIIDLRNNTGGNFVDTQHLFSYFADSTFHFVNSFTLYIQIARQSFFDER